MYTIAKAISIIKRVELVGKKQLATIALNLDDGIFIIYITFFISSNLGLDIYLFEKVQISFFKTNEIFTSILSKYANFVSIFSKDLAAKLLKHNGMNNHIMNLVED